MLKLSKSDHFGIAKAMSQVLIYSFLKVSLEFPRCVMIG